MMEQVLDEADARMIHALQIAPRAPWSRVGRILDQDPVTLARRWQRLLAEGTVWTTIESHSPRSASAIVEIGCLPGRTRDIAARLAQDPEARIIDLTAGSREIIATVRASSDEALADYVFERLNPLEAVTSMRTHLVSEVVRDASAWRLRALGDHERQALEQLARPTSRAIGTRTDPDLEAGILAGLTHDARMSHAALASRLAVSPTRVREGIERMRLGRRATLRVHVQRQRSGWPIDAWYFLRVPAEMVSRVGAQLGQLEEIRQIVHAVGPYNLIMAVWLRALPDVQALEAMIESRLPGVQIADHSVVMRTTKNAGRLIGDDGRAHAPSVAETETETDETR